MSRCIRCRGMSTLIWDIIFSFDCFSSSFRCLFECTRARECCLKMWVSFLKTLNRVFQWYQQKKKTDFNEANSSSDGIADIFFLWGVHYLTSLIISLTRRVFTGPVGCYHFGSLLRRNFAGCTLRRDTFYLLDNHDNSMWLRKWVQLADIRILHIQTVLPQEELLLVYWTVCRLNPPFPRWIIWSMRRHLRRCLCSRNLVRIRL